MGGQSYILNPCYATKTLWRLSNFVIKSEVFLSIRYFVLKRLKSDLEGLKTEVKAANTNRNTCIKFKTNFLVKNPAGQLAKVKKDALMNEVKAN